MTSNDICLVCDKPLYVEKKFIVCSMSHILITVYLQISEKHKFLKISVDLQTALPAEVYPAEGQ
jgi:hypothetical protein